MLSRTTASAVDIVRIRRYPLLSFSCTLLVTEESGGCVRSSLLSVARSLPVGRASRRSRFAVRGKKTEPSEIHKFTPCGPNFTNLERLSTQWTRSLRCAHCRRLARRRQKCRPSLRGLVLLADALRAPRIQRRGGEFPLPGQAQQRLHLMARLVARVGRRAVRLAQRREELAQHRFRSAPLLPGLGRAPLAVSRVHRGLLVRPPVFRALRRGVRR